MLDLPNIPIWPEVVDHHRTEPRGTVRGKRPFHSIDSCDDGRSLDRHWVGNIQMKGHWPMNEVNALPMEKEPIAEERLGTRGHGVKFLADPAQSGIELGRPYKIDELGKLPREIRLHERVPVSRSCRNVHSSLQKARIWHRPPRLPPLQSAHRDSKADRRFRLGIAFLRSPRLQSPRRIVCWRLRKQLSRLINRYGHFFAFRLQYIRNLRMYCKSRCRAFRQLSQCVGHEIICFSKDIGAFAVITSR